MKNEKKALATGDILRQGVATLRATRRETLLILALGMIGPQVLLSLIFDVHSLQVVDQLRRLFAEAPAGVDFQVLAAPALAYLGRLGFFLILIFVMLMASYFSLVHVVVGHHRGEPPLGAGAALLKGLRTALPQGFILVLALILLMFVGQILIAPALLVAVLSLALPVILVAERKGAWRSLRDALTLRYVRQSVYSGWTVLFTLLSLAAFLYASIALVAMLCELLLLADERLGVSRDLWAGTLPGLGLGPVYLLVSVTEAVVTMALLAALPALTAALYFEVCGKREITRA